MPGTGQDDLPVRRYNDAEVRELLERAVRMQRRISTPVHAQGLTLEQLEEIAAEAHIDVATLRDAARELDMERTMRPAGALERLMGAPLRIHIEEVLPFEVEPGALGALPATIGATVGDAGTSSLVGRTYTFSSHASSGRRLDVRVSVMKNRTHVSIEERYTEIGGGLFGGVIGGVGGGVGFGVGGGVVASAFGTAAGFIAFPLAVAGISYAACRLGFSGYVRSRARTLRELCGRIVQDLTMLHDSERG